MFFTYKIYLLYQVIGDAVKLRQMELISKGQTRAGVDSRSIEKGRNENILFLFKHLLSYFETNQLLLTNLYFIATYAYLRLYHLNKN